MKITLNKYEFAIVIRNCMRAREGYDGCGKCALQGICSEPDTFEDICIIDGTEAVKREAVNDISNLH